MAKSHSYGCPVPPGINITPSITTIKLVGKEAIMIWPNYINVEVEGHGSVQLMELVDFYIKNHVEKKAF